MLCNALCKNSNTFEAILQSKNSKLKNSKLGAMAGRDVRSRIPVKTAAKTKATPQNLKLSAAEAKALKNEQSGMITHWKKSPLAECAAALQHYQSMDRFAPEKKLMLAEFRKDKKCLWFKDFVQTHSKSSQKASSSLEGYATQF